MDNKDLWVRYKEENDQQAKEALIVEHIGLANSIVNKIYPKYSHYIEYDDLMGYGALGLIDAIEKFDHTKGLKFSTYANLRVRGAIIDEIRVFNWVPRGVRARNKKLYAAIDELEQRFGTSYTDQQVADKLEMELDEYREFKKDATVYTMHSLDSKRYIQETESTPEDELCKKEDISLLASGIEKLDNRARKIIELYFYSELTYEEVGEIIGMTAGGVYHVVQRTLDKLKKHMHTATVKLS